ncbi:MAG: PBP1A family penicillin-binding protein [Chloroflexi bacterium]|nr:PBP1A family penicillin-binding protein [Chloroflexota bacterium]
MKTHHIVHSRNRKLRDQRGGRRATYVKAGGLATLVFVPLVLALVMLIFVSTLVGGGLTAYAYFSKDLAPPETMTTRQVSRSTLIFDRNGTLLYEVFDPKGGKRTTVPLSEISPWLIKATIATEDADFYLNPGINIRGIVRAALNLIKADAPLQGGSSITQQLAKNVLIAEEERTQRSMARKIKEVIYAYEMTRRYSKDQILEWYLNENNYGNLSYGIEAAAESYFEKPAKDLTLAESALLAGLPQAPAYYSPSEHPERARARQATVLDLMVRQGYITEREADEAKREELRFAARTFDIEAPHFVMYVRELLERKYGVDAVYRGGLRVTTSLDLGLQEVAQDIVSEQVKKLEKNNAHNAALVAIVPTTGEIKAMVGSANYWNEKISGQINMANSPRQPGSSFKPFSYVTAFAKGYTPATMLLDVRTSFPDGINPPYVPENVDRRFEGPVSIRHALSTSRNIPAVKTLAFAGLQEVINTAHRMGITTLTQLNRYGLSLTLGGGEVKLLDMVYAYGVFANGGNMAGVPVPEKEQKPNMRKLDPVAILKIEDSQGQVLEEFKAPMVQPVVSSQLSYLITDILSDNEARAAFFGANNPLRLKGRPAAAKTGTTNDWRDNWTIGYTPQLVTGVWVGNADFSQMYESYGSTAAAPIWSQFMEKALEGQPAEPFKVSSGIVKATVCAISGQKPTPLCDKTKTEVFLEGTVPQKPCDVHQAFRIDRTTGKLATSATPPQNVEEQVFLVLPPEASDWMEANGIPRPPTEYSPVTTAAVAITSPQPGAIVRGNLTITGSARVDNFARFTLEYGAGLTPKQWLSIGAPKESAVVNGTLGNLDASRLNGLYALRLTVVDKGQQSKQTMVAFTVDNVPPLVKVSYPPANGTLTIKPNAGHIGIQAEVTDEFGVSRVEFLMDGTSIGSTSVSPYNRQWQMTRGRHTIQAISWDKAGNEARSEPITITVN